MRISDRKLQKLKDQLILIAKESVQNEKVWLPDIYNSLVDVSSMFTKFSQDMKIVVYQIYKCICHLRLYDKNDYIPNIIVKLKTFINDILTMYKIDKDYLYQIGMNK